jgi:hypothetical protein
VAIDRLIYLKMEIFKAKIKIKIVEQSIIKMTQAFKNKAITTIKIRL